jgi:hypothetical protein
MPKVQKFKKINDKFVETGCYLGDGIQLALDSGFEEIFSIELAPKYIKVCEDRFVNKKINFIEGDSYTELSRLLNRFPVDKFTYWLDGHYSGNDTGRGVKDFPIMEELEVILRRDVSGENNPNFGQGWKQKNYWQNLSKEERLEISAKNSQSALKQWSDKEGADKKRSGMIGKNKTRKTQTQEEFEKMQIERQREALSHVFYFSENQKRGKNNYSRRGIID